MDNKEDVNCESIYPVNKVGWGYSLMGGATGGLIIGLLFVFDTQSIEISTSDIVLVMLFGTIFGLIPSIITGFLIAQHEIKISGAKDYYKLFLIGLFVSSVYALIVTVGYLFSVQDFSIDSFIQNVLPITAIMGLIGGLSSVVLGMIIVPKVKP